MICYLNKKILSLFDFVRIKNEYPYLIIGKRFNSFFVPENLVPFDYDIMSDADYMDFFESNSSFKNHIGFLLNNLPEQIPLHLTGNIIIVDSFNVYQGYYTDIKDNKSYFKEMEIILGEVKNELFH
jgi:hypothetical protein